MIYIKDPMFKRAPDVLAERRDRFAELNADVRARGGWIVSVAGDKTVVVETLECSNVPAFLRGEGFALEEIEGGERILPHRVQERFILNADGSLGSLVAGSSKPMTMVVSHPGIAATRKYRFDIT